MRISCVSTILLRQFVADDIGASRNIFFDIISPESQYNPALRFEDRIDFTITLYIAFDFRNPVVAVGMDFFFFVFPIIPVPEFAVAEHGYLLPNECYIGMTWYFFTVFAITDAS